MSDNDNDNKGLLLVGGVAAALTLNACGGGGGSGGSTVAPPEEVFNFEEPDVANVIKIMTVAVTTDTSDITTINGETVANNEYSVELDNSDMPEDPGRLGEKAPYTFSVDIAGTTPEAHDFEVSLNTPPQIVLDTIDAEKAAELGHLYSRTGFGPNLGELYRHKDSDYATVVDEILADIRTDSFQPLLGWIDDHQYSNAERNTFTQEQKDALDDQNNERRSDLKQWWYREMVVTNSPLTERLVMFWHGLWTSSLDNVLHPQMMYKQNVLYRQHATNFRTFAHAVPEDPAMVMYLDSNSNVKGEPNENFARELMELFTLGEGQGYTEADIAEVARCFTGYGLTENFAFEFDPTNHDTGNKTVLGQTGNFNGSQVIDMLLSMTRTAAYITEKLWDEFIGGERDQGVINSWAGVLRDNDYDLIPLLRTMFLSPTFRDPARYGVRVKSPVEMLVSIFRRLQVEPASGYEDWVWMNPQMGQAPLQPPSVQGWPKGTDWIDANTLVNRRDKLLRVGRGLRDVIGNGMEEGLGDLLYAIPAVLEPDTSSWRNYLQSVISDPAMNLA